MSSKNYGGSKIAPIVRYWPRTTALDIILLFLFRRHLVLNKFPFLFSTLYITRELCNKRRSLANILPFLTSSFTSPVLCYWRADSALTGEAEQIRKSVNFVICAASAPCFAYRSKANAEPIILAAKYISIAIKGLSHEIFRPVFWPVWMHLDLHVNRLWLKNSF